MKAKTLLNVGLLILLTAVAQASQDQLARSIKDARVETTRTIDQLKTTLDALTALTKQTSGDLRPAYDAFAAEIPKTEAASTWTGLRVKWMAGDGEQYFKSWQKTIDGISNESLRKKAQKRLDAAHKSYAKVETSLQQAAEKFKPFLSDLTDVQKALSKDVTPAGVKAIRGVVRSANWNYTGVNKAVNAALKEMQKMEKDLSSEIQ